jgi:copper chaperone
MSMHTSSYEVVGMTCEHCVRSVTEEVASVPGVDSVEVSLESGALMVTGPAPADDKLVRAAVQEAGYELR